MAETYNGNHAATLDMVEDLTLMAIESMKGWTLENVDKTEIMKHIKAQLDLANRTVIGTTAAEKCQYLLNCIDAITGALRSAGAIIPDETPLDEYATLVRQISASGYEICILGKSGTHYSTTQWNEYIAQHGTEPESGAVVAVITPFQSFVIGLPPVDSPQSYKKLAWGNTSDNVTGLYGQQAGSFVNVLQNSLNFKSLENTYRMLLWYDPEVLPHCNYDPNDPDKDYGSYGCIRFATKAEMEASGQHLMSDQQVYIVTNDETDNTTNQCYYWNGAAYTRRFVVPRTGNITGSPAAKYAWEYKAWDGDTRQYTLPTTNHLLMMYVYYNEINACLSTLNLSPLPTGSSWSCQQNSANYAYYVTIPSAGVYNLNKGNAYAVVPVAAL
ncbi:MAG: hypothetical protein II825_03750 [Paludibacteraceae bacterium]|nr:hypothetical protein [Paludibacteraceae bacterium]